MAGEWIKVRLDLPEDPAVYRLSRITGLDRLSVIGRLYAFWAWADKHAVDGRVDGASTLDVDDITRHDGFADAMAQVKWLEVGPDYLAIPKHDRHNGESAKERGLKNARQARWRDGKGADVDAPPSTKKTTKASTREEKRREDISPIPPAGGEAKFEDFWNAWPANDRKQDKTKCAKKWKSDRLDAAVDLILADIAVKRQTQKWREGFVEAPLVYLNGKRWEDGVTPDGEQAGPVGAFV